MVYMHTFTETLLWPWENKMELNSSRMTFPDCDDSCSLFKKITYYHWLQSRIKMIPSLVYTDVRTLEFWCIKMLENFYILIYFKINIELNNFKGLEIKYTLKWFWVLDFVLLYWCCSLSGNFLKSLILHELQNLQVRKKS